MSDLTFRHLNTDWNAEPNAPTVDLSVDGDTVRVSFFLNPWAYEAKSYEIGVLTFSGCNRWRWDSTNDHAWFAGNGLFSGQAPMWGEFYEVFGDSRPVEEFDWERISPDGDDARQFLFYFRDDTLEVVASDWSFDRPSETNHSTPSKARDMGALARLWKRLSGRQPSH